MIRYKPLFNLEEDLRVTDLMKSSGMSDFTKGWAKKRGKEKGREVNLAKYLECEIDVGEDFVLARWATEPTYEFDIKATDHKKNFSFHDDNLYTMEIKFLDVFDLISESGEEVTNELIDNILLTCNVKLWCDCPSLHFQGQNYNLSMFDASLHPTDIASKWWSPKFHNDDQFLCKHLGRLINTIKFYIPQIRMSIKKELGLTTK